MLNDNTRITRRADNEQEKYPYLGYSQLRNCVYIVISKEEKIDVTKQFENIADMRKVIGRKLENGNL